MPGKEILIQILTIYNAPQLIRCMTLHTNGYVPYNIHVSFRGGVLIIYVCGVHCEPGSAAVRAATDC